MAEKLKRQCCANCIYLDKTRRKEVNNGTGCYRYGCNLRFSDGYVCGWIRKDGELKTQGCSDCNKIRVGTKIKVKSRFADCEKTFLYCGKYIGKPLLYCMEERKMRIQPFDCLRTQTGKLKTNIEVIRQEKEEFEKSIKMAKMLKRRYIEDEQEALPFY